mmetsp:Transcript_37513/g.74690  ORF Transcript_37513/g.74690 Transcript_37513/m.74690 type:complete len:328 (+) Transcript_37513:305-1288(+)
MERGGRSVARTDDAELQRTWIQGRPPVCAHADRELPGGVGDALAGAEVELAGELHVQDPPLGLAACIIHPLVVEAEPIEQLDGCGPRADRTRRPSIGETGQKGWERRCWIRCRRRGRWGRLRRRLRLLSRHLRLALLVPALLDLSLLRPRLALLVSPLPQLLLLHPRLALLIPTLLQLLLVHPRLALFVPSRLLLQARRVQANVAIERSAGPNTVGGTILDLRAEGVENLAAAPVGVFGNLGLLESGGLRRTAALRRFRALAPNRPLTPNDGLAAANVAFVGPGRGQPERHKRDEAQATRHRQEHSSARGGARGSAAATRRRGPEAR